MNLVKIDPNNVTEGMAIIVQLMPDGCRGQGGNVLSIDKVGLTLRCGANDDYDRSIAWSEVYRIDVNEPFALDRCLNYGEDCQGPVDYHTTGSSERAWLRCDFHQEQRQRSYEGSMERYADSDVMPDWFHEDDIGEHWFED